VNWEIIGATGEWAGALVVALTLIYLAVQIRQQNRIAKYSAWETIIDGMNQQLTTSSPETVFAYLKGRNEPDRCSDLELDLQRGPRAPSQTEVT